MRNRMIGSCIFCGKTLLVDGINTNNHYVKTKHKTVIYFHRECYDASNCKRIADYAMTMEVNNE